MKVTPENITMIAEKMEILMKARGYTKAEIKENYLFDLWHGIHAETVYDNDHPRFTGRERIFPQNRDFPLYPDNCDDKSLLTALKKSFKLVKE